MLKKNQNPSYTVNLKAIEGNRSVNELVDQYGPFVMNPQVEIDMTIEDIHNVKDGFANGQWLV
ncbi:pirin carboxy-terminal region protein [Arabidopsis thaliana]|uniref:Pirin carboxy-terminal region protein n=1 Tax=Arabidopsis thaliana TaxID=3702 RepID=A0A1I9LQP1_ARATH|nr:pirin carboxy-terminal region protein [Arabidopsis thaliana]ANM64899.1 pirin carboxy-terminal region protein [Arabidopsis thaliana]|eukprot:NP_001326901.1 pirin carboxy-terminal region protein [Arabidopsis thaliana]